MMKLGSGIILETYKALEVGRGSKVQHIIGEFPVKYVSILIPQRLICPGDSANFPQLHRVRVQT